MKLEHSITELIEYQNFSTFILIIGIICFITILLGLILKNRRCNSDVDMKVYSAMELAGSLFLACSIICFIANDWHFSNAVAEDKTQIIASFEDEGYKVSRNNVDIAAGSWEVYGRDNHGDMIPLMYRIGECGEYYDIFYQEDNKYINFDKNEYC